MTVPDPEPIQPLLPDPEVFPSANGTPLPPVPELPVGDQTTVLEPF